MVTTREGHQATIGAKMGGTLALGIIQCKTTVAEAH